MTGFIIGLFTLGLVFICLFAILIVLMQRASANSGVGSALGGGAAESALGVDSGNILTKWTIYCTVAFFVLSFGLYLAYMAKMDTYMAQANVMPTIEAGPADDYTPGSLTEIPNE